MVKIGGNNEFNKELVKQIEQNKDELLANGGPNIGIVEFLLRYCSGITSFLTRFAGDIVNGTLDPDDGLLDGVFSGLQKGGEEGAISLLDIFPTDDFLEPK